MSIAPVIAKKLSYKVTTSDSQSWAFDKPVVTIGRGAENDIVFAADAKVSRQHAEIRVHLGSLYVRNVSPKNFILVNGERVDEKLIEGRAQIQIGEQLLSLEIDEDKSQAPMHLAPAVPQNSPVTTASAVRQSPARVDLSVMNSQMPNAVGSPQPASAFPPSRPMGGGPTPNYGFKVNAATPQNNRIIIYAVIFILGIGGYWLLSDSGSKRTGQELRMESDVLQDIQATEDRIQELEEAISKRGEDTIQYKTAQQHYIRGFRDYRNGQYARAIQSFQAALSFYPQHELAQKYRVLASRKFDEQVQQHMILGRRYKGRGNFRLCQSSFASAMVMLKDPNSKQYQEAKKSYDECQLLDERR